MTSNVILLFQKKLFVRFFFSFVFADDEQKLKKKTNKIDTLNNKNYCLEIIKS